jgi:UV DNA damage endonuclease
MKNNFNLGYACINTELRSKKIFTSRTCRLATLEKKGLQYIKGLALTNLQDLLKILQWNKENGISFMRLSSDIFPFASHKTHGYKIDFADDILQEIGDYVNDNNMRVTFHPSQYNVLSSPNSIVIENTMLDLNHHANILDKMGMGPNSVVVIHGGGVYNNKNEAKARLKQNLLKLPKSTRDRIVLENCEIIV